MIGKLLAKTGLSSLQGYIVGGMILTILSLGSVAYWQYNVAVSAKVKAVQALDSANAANVVIEELEAQRTRDIQSLKDLSNLFNDAQDALVRAQNDLSDLRGEDSEEFIKNNPDVAAGAINDRARRLFRELACETGSRADCEDTPATSDTTK